MGDLICVASLDCCNLSFHVHLQASNVPLNHLRLDTLELIWQLLFLLLRYARLLYRLLLDVRLFFIEMTLEVRFVVMVHIDASYVLHEVWLV